MASKQQIDYDRLCTSMQRSRMALQRFRENRREMVKQYVGRWWSENGTREKVPVNLIALYVSVVARNLIAKNPRVMLSTFRREQKPLASAMQEWANAEIEAMGFADTEQRVVMDALFSIGVCKVALSTPAESATGGWGVPAGRPFAEAVDLDDFVFDSHARCFGEASFVGHRFRVAREAALETYGRKRADDMPASDDPFFNSDGDERISMLGRGYQSSNTEEFEDMVDLWEVYLPRHRLIVTLHDDHVTGSVTSNRGPLKVQRWVGPDCGPYHVLAYGTVPGNAMPKGPIQDLVDLHDATNRLYRKAIRQADRQKEILAVEGGAMEDGTRIVQADDGEAIKVNNPERSKVLNYGGPDQKNFAMAVHLADKFSYQAGNLDAMGGLSPQSKTLGQDRLLAEGASKAVADMQDATVTHVASVAKALCWYWHHDPHRVMEATHAVPGMPAMQYSRGVTPAERAGLRFEDLGIKVDPYSIQHSTPSSRLQAMNGVVTQIVIPMMQLMVQQGIAFDMSAYLEKVGRYLDMPDLAEILTIQEPPPPGPGGAGGQSGGGMPQSTERKYVRENRSEATREASDRNMVQSLMGHNAGGNPDAQPAKA